MADSTPAPAPAASPRQRVAAAQPVSAGVKVRGLQKAERRPWRVMGHRCMMPALPAPGAMQTRKPYTITKQRERWTEEEHEKFLEAIRLHGRAWRRIEGKQAARCMAVQRIARVSGVAHTCAAVSCCAAHLPLPERGSVLLPSPPFLHPEHIGTKTAVQIRSHAQKFFSKVERLKEEGEGEQGEPSSSVVQRGSSSKIRIHAGRTRCCAGIQVTSTYNLEGMTCSSLHQAC